MVNRANEVQLSLQHNPANWDRAPEPRSDDASHYLLSFISQPTPAVDWKEQTVDSLLLPASSPDCVEPVDSGKQKRKHLHA
ncbi:hypothetical protein HaLaN_00386 [Haematococcus lacustris]|uniref:Uncharacterized protein n=1 Tax=Haematococcus lacustris TaxID=44745 RepID=A0A699Y949_HAELA|nr:hypothetical protein HaLaN_00386 [Haematococcus lacustris]